MQIKKLNQFKESFFISVRSLKLVWGIHKGIFLGSLFSTLLPGIIPYVNIYIYKLIIDLVVRASQLNNFDYSQLYLLLGIRILVQLITELCFSLQSFMQKLLWQRVPVDFLPALFGKISSLDAERFENSDFKDLLEKTKESFQVRIQILVWRSFLLIQSLLQVVIAFIAIAHLSWFLVGLIILITIPGFIVQIYETKSVWGIWSANTPIRKRFWYLTTILQDYRFVKETKLFKLARRFIIELKKIQRDFYDENVRVIKKSFYFSLLSSSFSTAIYMVIEIYVIFQTIAKKNTVGDIGFYTGVVLNFQNGLGGLIQNLNAIFENTLYVKSVFEVMDTPQLITSKKEAIKIELNQPPMIEFRDVTFAYPGSEVNILKNFSITINPGEKVAFVGENGAGKTTIVKLLARFYDIKKGQILINGIDIKDLDLDSWYQSMGVLFQDFNRYEHTAQENIHFGNVESDLDLEKIIAASISAGAHPVIKKLEKQYEQMLGKTFEGGVELSTGQWQKIALARAFFRNAPVLILDEPTASIDAKAESEIFNKVEKLSKDKTVIIISHRFSTVRNADKIYVIDNGKIVESGSHEQLMKIEGQYASLFKLQAKGYQ